ARRAAAAGAALGRLPRLLDLDVAAFEGHLRGHRRRGALVVRRAAYFDAQRGREGRSADEPHGLPRALAAVALGGVALDVGRLVAQLLEPEAMVAAAAARPLGHAVDREAAVVGVHDREEAVLAGARYGRHSGREPRREAPAGEVLAR